MKKGDPVICVDDTYVNLTAGKRYDVQEPYYEASFDVWVCNDSGELLGYSPDRFKLDENEQVRRILNKYG